MPSVLLTNEMYRLSVRVLPATVGVNDVHLYAHTPEGEPADVKEWRATAAPSNQDIEPVRLSLLPITADHAIGQANLPSAGQWRFTFSLRLTEIDQASVTATFDIITG